MTYMKEYFYKVCLLAFYQGSPNFWIDDLNMTKIFSKRYRAFSKCLNALLPCFAAFELGGYITQTNLTKKQESDLLIYGGAHPLLLSYSIILWSQEKKVKNLISNILKLSEVYSDENMEKKILKKATIYTVCLALTCWLSVLLHSISAFIKVAKSEGTFTTVVTIWPLVDDSSTSANIIRVLSNIVWWIFVSRIVSSYMVVITLATSVAHLYMNLQRYFYSLTDIFETNLPQEENERKYQKAFKVGIDLHTNTRECTYKLQNICKGIFGGQIVFITSMLAFLMIQMLKSERTLVNASATGITVGAVLGSTGFFLWNAGDITIEASNVSMAMYFSGWHHCQRENSFKIRQLVSGAMLHAQKPVELKGLGIITLSYNSYLSLVKSSYSVFSVIY